MKRKEMYSATISQQEYEKYKAATILIQPKNNPLYDEPLKNVVLIGGQSMEKDKFVLVRGIQDV